MLVYGRNVAKEMLLNEKRVNKIYLQENFNDKEIIFLIKKREIVVENLPKFEMNKKTNGNHQGIILDIENIKNCNQFLI